MTTEITQALKHQERIVCVRETPVEKQCWRTGVWQDHTFIEALPYEISRRENFTPANGADPRYQFELWDEQGFIGAYRIKIKVWDDCVKILPAE